MEWGGVYLNFLEYLVKFGLRKVKAIGKARHQGTLIWIDGDEDVLNNEMVVRN